MPHLLYVIAVSLMLIRPAVYRVEHRLGTAMVVLGHLQNAAHHHAALAPYVTHLHLAGRGGGELLLVEVATGLVVARRLLDAAARRRSSTRAAARHRAIHQVRR